MTELAKHVESMVEDYCYDICDKCPLYTPDYYDGSCDYSESVGCPINIFLKNSEVVADAIRSLAFVQNDEFLKGIFWGSSKP